MKFKQLDAHELVQGQKEKLTNFGEIKRKSKFLKPTTFIGRMFVGICFELVLYFSLII